MRTANRFTWSRRYRRRRSTPSLRNRLTGRKTLSQREYLSIIITRASGRSSHPFFVQVSGTYSCRTLAFTVHSMGSRMAKKRGRPPGSKSRDYDHVQTTVSRCKACKSVERTAYSSPETIRFSGTYTSPLDNAPYNALIRRKCQCKNCGRWRRDDSYVLIDKSTVNQSVAVKPDKVTRPRTARHNRT